MHRSNIIHWHMENQHIANLICTALLCKMILYTLLSQDSLYLLNIFHYLGLDLDLGMGMDQCMRKLHPHIFDLEDNKHFYRDQYILDGKIHYHSIHQENIGHHSRDLQHIWLDHKFHKAHSLNLKDK